MSELLDAVLSSGKSAARVLGTELEVVSRPALSASAVDVLEADGLILGTPVNIGYMSGALKHFFDQIYYPCLADTGGLPIGVYLHGNSDAAGAVRGIEKITGALNWRPAAPPVIITDKFGKSAAEELAEATSLVVAAIAERAEA